MTLTFISFFAKKLEFNTITCIEKIHMHDDGKNKYIDKKCTCNDG